ncbi:sigma 54-interacting transcriptional regulator [Megalodesulfovibrio gigas]|uniref:Putative sigma54 specific transcriptional regulator n=1 Tax=Megalodesulfovibrio gigas (strain ATCC 19364 / DSM 1382 / NCIMB 9332 / VKM B-1759) TaxID=1121448 RepID=T2G8E3_MEGG1|nr:sigma 54-interacting transcriptional regulator [Megalodesulfovibrio gigas]AGW12454.1 putative sigma54 specific transcriptional regulator [Megalodesulfovibrio gigas DSM 1382 = ATCC 19364]
MTAPHATSLPPLEDLAQATCARDFLDAFDGYPHGVVVMDACRRVLYLNRRMEELTGRSRATCLGLPCAQVVRTRLCMHGCTPPQTPGKLINVETDLLAAGRRLLPVRLTGMPLLPDSGAGPFRIEIVEEMASSGDECARCARGFRSPGGSARILGRSAQIEKLLEVLPALARSDAPLFFCGETGVGKDVFAEVAHALSLRSREPFVRVNVSPMPDTLLDVELFGAAEGGLPWVEHELPGAFRKAGGGTVYLAELGDLPLPHQARLLHMLEQGTVTPVGGKAPVSVSCRLLAATNADPELLIRQGRLRVDLAKRLDTFRIVIPPLREREGDVLYLAQRFLEHSAASLRRKIDGFSRDAQTALTQYVFPGNIRELKNIVEYAVMVCQGGQILAEHLPPHLALAATAGRSTEQGHG